jgi:polyhydroxyalkanoate synthase
MFGPIHASTFKTLDAVRRAQGETLQRLGLGTVETPSRVAGGAPGFVLRDFGAEGGGAPDLLLVPAPIKSPALWDLMPGASVVRSARAAGFRVWRIDWTADGAPPADRGLDAFAGRMLAAAVDLIAAETGRRRPVLAGHSLGGTFVGLFAARHPGVPAAVILAEGPLAFAPGSGALADAARAAPADAFETLDTIMPGSLLGAIAARILPDEFQWWRMSDRLLAATDPTRLRIHLAVDRWAHDEFPMPRRLFLDVLGRLYRSDAFVTGTLELDGVRIRPQDIVAPVLAVMDPGGRVVPETAIRPALDASASGSVRTIAWRPEVGTALRHVAALVGPDAHRRLWPDVLVWARDHATGG